MKASVAESNLSWAKEQLTAANLKDEDLEARLASLSREISLSKETAEQAVSSIINDSRSQLSMLQKRILQLESVNALATGRSEKLIELYRSGKLVCVSERRILSTRLTGRVDRCREIICLAHHQRDRSSPGRANR